MKLGKNVSGFSMLELVIVVTIIMIFAGASIFYLNAHQRLLRPDDQALKLVDLFQEARQRSLTQRETMRVEIDLTDNMARLYDENSVSTANDDKKIREITLQSTSYVSVNTPPPDITTTPSDPVAFPNAEFTNSVYTPTLNHSVFTLRFRPNGTVVNAGTTPTGTGATVTGATLFIWSPDPKNTSNSEIARAITVFGTTGLIKFWEYDRNLTSSNKWKDSRRFGQYGSTN